MHEAGVKEQPDWEEDDGPPSTHVPARAGRETNVAPGAYSRSPLGWL